MTYDRSLSRRSILTAGAAVAGAVAMPTYLRAQGAAVKIGILQPVTGALAFDGQQGLFGAEIALHRRCRRERPDRLARA